MLPQVIGKGTAEAIFLSQYLIKLRVQEM